jgi:hypothetical protein
MVLAIRIIFEKLSSLAYLKFIAGDRTLTGVCPVRNVLV